MDQSPWFMGQVSSVKTLESYLFIEYGILMQLKPKSPVYEVIDRRFLTRSIVVSHLSPAFQRFAVRTFRKVEDVSKIARQKKLELAEQVKDISKNLKQSFKG
ncbi:hypothetical protein K2173_000048 [Erythroxylum novogranatense]|uniref:Uncharacterized protein n=1 Tax=Erythroxylum novogranatense TaxID=1862640 RepID=A0AAV8SPD2_9ROSI|nr:hypothetical protein K2173_000048 [Erythroxylum novogranatense]